MPRSCCARGCFRPGGRRRRSGSACGPASPTARPRAASPKARCIYRCWRPRAGRWLALALLLSCVWAGRGLLIGQALATHTRAARRFALVLDPAYALLASERDFQRGLAAWNETRLPTPDANLLDGQGYFGAHIADSGVRRALDNDYLPVLMLREVGLRGLGLLVLAYLTLLALASRLASERFRDGSHAQRARLLIALVLGALCVYQPLASVGVLPLTGIAWPGLGLNSPTDFWLFVALVLALVCWGGGGEPAVAPATAEDNRLETFDRQLRTLGLYR